MALTSAEKSKRFKAKKRNEGKRYLQVWVSDANFQKCIDAITRIECRATS